MINGSYGWDFFKPGHKVTIVIVKAPVWPNQEPSKPFVAQGIVIHVNEHFMVIERELHEQPLQVYKLNLGSRYLTIYPSTF